ASLDRPPPRLHHLHWLDGAALPCRSHSAPASDKNGKPYRLQSEAGGDDTTPTVSQDNRFVGNPTRCRHPCSCDENPGQVGIVGRDVSSKEYYGSSPEKRTNLVPHIVGQATWLACCGPALSRRRMAGESLRVPSRAAGTPAVFPSGR